MWYADQIGYSRGSVVRLKVFGGFLALFGLLCGQAMAGEIRRESLSSRHLGQELPFLVYVPDGYALSGETYPVLYLLHGFGDNEKAWVERAAIQARADRLIASGVIPPALIVMPGCAKCWWVDGGQETRPGFKAESAFWSELVPAVASRYRTIESREGRVIAGFSAGGYGAIRFALKYPDRLAAAGAFSPAIYADSPPPASAARIQSPFIGLDGQFNQVAWSEQNYPRLIGGYFEQTRRVPMYLVAGDNDRLGIAFETVLFFKRVFEKQPDLVELRVVDGGHGWSAWSGALDDVMIYLFRFAAKPMPTARPVRNGLAQNRDTQTPIP
jgi:enterochelin esterase-like enzyme